MTILNAKYATKSFSNLRYSHVNTNFAATAFAAYSINIQKK